MIYEEKSVPHTVGGPVKIESERLTIEYMNEDLRQAGKLYDPKPDNVQERLWQDDSANGSVMAGKKGLAHDANGDHRAAGATVDFIKITWINSDVITTPDGPEEAGLLRRSPCQDRATSDDASFS
ncbi:hypothetical protein [Streptomyces hydrogenans]|uniref:hypothetical protein n=1 Tax=Streptomyces hydrogenans TaxID=1873719 RepID=UPI003809C867